jgi:colanic acid biosynthesis protein WcaH
VNITEAIEILEKQIKNPLVGLPDEIFYFISKLTPMVNVDLLIKDEKGRTLLAWRDDQFSKQGWHLPGGIIRFKETVETRVKKVAETEIGAEVNFDSIPIAFNEIICDHDVRGHFLSFLYKCSLNNSFIPLNKGLSKNDPGYLMWHEVCPTNLIKVHEIYRKYI